MKGLKLHEKILIALLAVSVIGFLMAPCCWQGAHKISGKHVIGCASNELVYQDKGDTARFNKASGKFH